MSTLSASTASTTTWLFWSMTGLDLVGLLIILISTLRHQGGSHNDGGSEIGIYMYLIMPGIALTLAVLLFVVSKRVIWKGLATLAVTCPSVLLVALLLHR